MKESVSNSKHYQDEAQNKINFLNPKLRFREIEKCIQNPKSLISYDGLLDSIQALAFDCEPMKKNKNVDNFLSRCNDLT